MKKNPNSPSVQSRYTSVNEALPEPLVTVKIQTLRATSRQGGRAFLNLRGEWMHVDGTSEYNGILRWDYLRDAGGHRIYD